MRSHNTESSSLKLFASAKYTCFRLIGRMAVPNRSIPWCTATNQIYLFVQVFAYHKRSAKLFSSPLSRGSHLCIVAYCKVIGTTISQYLLYLPWQSLFLMDLDDTFINSFLLYAAIAVVSAFLLIAKHVFLKDRMLNNPFHRNMPS